MAEETRQIAEFALGLSNAYIPSAVKERIRYLFLDNIASAYLGSRQASYRSAVNAMSSLGASGKTRIFGYPSRFDIARATFLNGVAIGCFEADHTAGGAHPGGSVFPAILALGSALGSTGEDVMRALVVGYEVNCRVNNAQTNAAEQVRGFHNPGIAGPFASAAGCGVLLELSLDEMLSALGIAGSHSSGLIEFVWTGAMTKRIHEGRAAQSGLESALLAQHGVTGPPTIFEGPYGYLQAFSPSPIPSRLIEGLGSEWQLEEVRVKPYAGHGTAQPFIPVLDAWRTRGIDANQVTSIEITTSTQGAEERFHELSPTSLLGIQYSMPIMLAIAATRGIEACIGVSEEILDDRMVRDLAAKVHIQASDAYNGNVISAGGEIAISHSGGVDTLKAPGVPRYDLQELRAQCRRKLRLYSAGMLSDEAVETIVEAVEHFDEMADCADLDEVLFN